MTFHHPLCSVCTCACVLRLCAPPPPCHILLVALSLVACQVYFANILVALSLVACQVYFANIRVGANKCFFFGFFLHPRPTPVSSFLMALYLNRAGVLLLHPLRRATCRVSAALLCLYSSKPLLGLVLACLSHLVDAHGSIACT